MQIFRIFGIFAATVLLSLNALALQPRFTYQGRIIKFSGEPVEAGTVQFRLQVRTPNASSCLMYEELKSIPMTGSKGSFSLTINDGLGSRQDSSGLDLDQVFANRGTFNFAGSDCAATPYNYSPAVEDGRKFRVLFNDGSGWSQIPDMDIAMAPFAVEAMQVSGLKAENLLHVVNGSGVPQSLSPLSPVQYTEFLALIGGTSTQYQRAGQFMGGTLPMGTMAHGYALRMGSSGAWESYDPGAGGGGSGTVTSVVAGAGLTGGNIISAGTIALSSVGTAGVGFKISYDQYGRVTGSAGIDEADIPTITTAGKVSGNAITSGTIGGNTSMSTTGTVAANQISTRGVHISNMEPKTISILPPSSITPVGGYTLTLPVDTGTAGQFLSTNGTGTLSWTSVAAGSSGIASVSGTAPISVTGTTSLVVSVADATDAAKGVVQLATSGGTIAGHVVQASDPRLSDARTTSGTAGGDLTGSYPSPTVAAIRNVAVNATGPSGAGQVLRYNGATEYAPAYLSLADIRSTTGPTYSQTFPSTSCTAKQTLTWSSITDTLTCSDIVLTAADVTGTVVNGGQNGAVTVGSNDLNTVTLETNNTARLTIGTTGNVGIGTTNPGTALEVQALSGSAINNISSTNTSPVAGSGSNLTFRGASNITMASIGNVIEATTSDSSLTFGTRQATGNPSEKMRITAAGNVGIGTTSPSAPLEVNPGSVVLTRTINDSFGNSIVMQKGRGAVVQNSDELGYTLFKGYDGSAYQVAAGIAAAVDGTPGANDMPGRLVFNTTPDGSATALERMRITSGGSVGIGVTAPAEKLDVAGNIKSSGTVGANAVCIAGDCKTAWPSSGGSGTVTHINEANGLETLSGSAITAGGTIGIANGGVTGAKLETLAGMTVGTFGSATIVPVITTDTKGRITAIGTTGITGLLPTGTTGQSLKYNGSTWVSSNILFSDMKNAAGTSAFDTTLCTTSQTVKWDSLTDMFTCAPISIDAAAITSGTIDAARLPASLSKWQDGTGGAIYYSAGNVGVGTGTPGIVTSAGRNYLTVKGSAGPGVLEVAQTAADAASSILGVLQFTDANSTGTEKRGGAIYMTTAGTTANNRGADLNFSVKADGASALVNKMVLDSNGDLTLNGGGYSTFGNTGSSFVGLSINNGHAGASGPASAVSMRVGGVERGNVKAEAGGSTTAGNLVFSVRQSGTMAEAVRFMNDGKVGIGVSSPSYTLDVRNAAATTAGFGVGQGAGSNTSIEIGTGATGDHLAHIDLGGDSTYSDWGMRIIRNQGANGSSEIAHRGTGTLAVFTNEAAPITFATSGFGSERMRITSGGSVGIGTNAPGALFEASGSAGSMAGIGKFTNTIGSNSIATALILEHNNGSAAGNINLGVALDFRGETAGVDGRIMGQIATQWTNALATDATRSAAMIFSTVDNGSGTPTERMRIESAGNVAIGTTGAARLLHVAGPIRVVASAAPSSPAAGDIYVDSSDTNKLKWYDGSGWQTAGGAGSSQWTTAGSNIHFATGSVGIGTTSPNRLLQVGSVSPVVQIGPNNGAIISTDSGGVGLFGSNLYWTSTNALKTAATNSGGFGYSGIAPGWGMIDFYTGSGNTTADATVAPTQRMRIDSSGNVGIGTTSPLRLLHVAGPIRLAPTALPAGAAGDLIFDSGASNALKFHNGSGWQTVTTGSAGATTIDALTDAKTDYTNFNMFFGTGVGGSTGGVGNTGMGAEALAALTNGQFNIAIGYEALKANTSGTYNTGIGFDALKAMTTNGSNTGIGAYALNTASGEKNTAVGSQSGFNMNGSNNTMIGWGAGAGSFTFNDVVYVGYGAGLGSSGGSNIAIGSSAGSSVTGTRNISIGVSSLPPSAAANNQLSIGNLIYGIGLDGSGATVSNGSIGIGTKTPASRLQVNGAITNTVASFTTAFTCGTSTLDFSTSNFQRLAPSNTIAAGTCNTALSNLVAGGSYTLIVTGNAATNAVTYNFTGYTFKYVPTNVATTAGKDTIYTFLYDGTTVYVTWSGGY